MLRLVSNCVLPSELYKMFLRSLSSSHLVIVVLTIVIYFSPQALAECPLHARQCCGLVLQVGNSVLEQHPSGENVYDQTCR